MCVIEGVMNLATTNNYLLVLGMESGLKPRARDVPPMGEPNGLQIRSAKIELRSSSGALLLFKGVDANGAPLSNPFEVSASGYIDPGGQNSININAIPPAYAAQLVDKSVQPPVTMQPQVTASVKVKGKTNGQVVVESGEFLWPIRLIYQSPKAADNLCTAESYCESLLGQDSFAKACSDAPK